jgi:hypothetical protein
MPIDSAAAAAAAEAARERALEAAREAQKKAQAEAAARAAEAAKAAQAAKVSNVRTKLKRDEMSTGSGMALRRGAISKLGAKGLDPAQPPDATAKGVKVKDLQNARPPDPVKDAAKLASISDPAQRAQAFEKLVTQNKDAIYRSQLIDQSKSSLQDLATQVVNKSSKASTDDRQQALNSLARATEQLDPASQQALAGTFAGAMKNQNVGDDSNEFGTLMKNSVKAGSGASLGVRLASALQSSDKTTAANDLSKFVGQGISDVRKQFDDDNKKLLQLHQELGQEVASWKLSGKDQTAALKQFDADHHLNDAQAKVEKDANALAMTLNGSAIAESDPALKAGAGDTQTVMAGRAGAITSDKFSNEKDLLSAAHDALGEIPALANTRAGSEAIANALAAQGQGQQTFLEQATADAKNAPSPKVIGDLRTAITQSMGSKLLESAKAGNFEETSSDLLNGLKKNAKLYGVNSEQLDELTGALKKFQPGMTDAALEAATKDTAAKIGNLNAPGPVGQAFKGLGVIFGAVGAVKGWASFDSEDVQTKLSTISQTLGVGQQGANLVTATLSRFAANSAEEAVTSGAAGSAAGATEAATAAAEEAAGLGAAKLLGAGIGALGAVVSGWQAVDAFEAGNTAQGVGDSMEAVGGIVATAGLFLDGTVAGAPVGVVLNVVGGLIAGAGALVGIFGGGGNPFQGQEKDLDGILQKMGVNKDVADKLNDFNSDGQNFGTWVSAVAGKLHMSTGDFVRSMNDWSPQQVSNFLDAARLQHDTDSNNDNRLKNASAVLGKQNAQNLEDSTYTPYGGGRFAVYNADAAKKADAQKQAQAAEREKVDKQTGVITYDPALVDAAAAWVRNGRQS